jgi:hypothetical protein
MFPGKTTGVLQAHFLLVASDLGFDHKESTETHSDLSRQPQQ